MADTSPADYTDVLIVGAGLSGVGAAYHLTRTCPGKSVVIVEARDEIGGTWDLFRYPGVRSDSDMFTLGYRFRPWTEPQSIADGDSILRYIRDTAVEAGIDRLIRLKHRVISATWDSGDALWTVTIKRTDTDDTTTMRCSFLYVCSGYYRYDEGYTPQFPGLQRFTGRVIHPQHWPSDLDYARKRVVVIGSGATAVTLVPAMAQIADHVTMLQRSPTYIASTPRRDRVADWLRARLPHRIAYPVVRWKNALQAITMFSLSRHRPALVKAMLRKNLIKQLPPEFDVDTHFTPDYNPWDQRLCLVPDGDLFSAITEGRANIVTDHVEEFTETGIRLRSGRELSADVVVTATGLNMLAIGGIALTVDDDPVEISKTVSYKGMMLSDVPNFAWTMGYTNASWTLKADLVAQYICRLLQHMERHRYDIVTPDATRVHAADPFLDLSSGYVMRSIDHLPRQGANAPWRLHQNYVRDVRLFRRGSIDDDVIFSRRTRRDQPQLSLRYEAGHARRAEYAD